MLGVGRVNIGVTVCVPRSDCGTRLYNMSALFYFLFLFCFFKIKFDVICDGDSNGLYVCIQRGGPSNKYITNFS